MTQGILRIGSVSYLNAKPLLYGLEDADYLQLHLDVPSRLLDGMRNGELDVALLPVIDYQRLPGLRVIPAGGIGCDGHTLTVRLFSHCPLEKIQCLICDTDSHTSVALARVILAERYGVRPVLVDWRHQVVDSSSALLLIGDKVVCEEPAGYPYQIDLGWAWKELTGRPFVFATWMAREGIELGELPQRLVSAKEQGMRNLDEIIQRFAVPRGWPVDIARRYMSEYLKYDIGAAQIEAMRYFYELGYMHGILSCRPQEIQVIKT